MQRNTIEELYDLDKDAAELNNLPLMLNIHDF